MRAVRWTLGACLDGARAILFVGLTIPLVLLGVAASVGVAVGASMVILDDGRGPSLAFGSLAILTFSVVVLALQDYLYNDSLASAQRPL